MVAFIEKNVLGTREWDLSSQGCLPDILSAGRTHSQCFQMVCHDEKMAICSLRNPERIPSVALKTRITRVHRPLIPPQAEEWFSRHCIHVLPQLVSQKTTVCLSYLSCVPRVPCHDRYTHGAEP